MLYRKNLKYIFLLSFAVAILFPLVNSFVIFPSFTDVLIQNTEDEAIRIGENLSSFVISQEDTIKSPAGFIEVIEKAKEDFNLEKIKVFSEKGVIIYSSDPADIGKINKKNYFFETVAMGKVFTKHVQKNNKTLEDRVVALDVIETYVPILVKGKFIGAFEIYYDVTEKKQVLGERAFQSSLISFSLVFGFFIVITVIIIKTDRSPDSVKSDKLSSMYQSPFFLLLFMLVAIFSAEIIIMFFLSILSPVSAMGRATLDASLLVMLVSPFLYFFLLRPLLLHIEERKQAEEDLRKSYVLLENRVEERTAELAETNSHLLEDINKRKRAEDLLFQAKHDWEDTFNTITDMITIHDRDYNILRANKAAEKILDLPLLQTTDLKCFKYYHGTDIQPANCISCKSLKSGKPSLYEVFEPNLDKFVEIRAIPRLDGNNEIVGMIHVVRDITDRKSSEKAVRESEERYRSLVESTDDSIYLVDLNYRYLFMNKQHKKRLNLTDDQYRGKSYSQFHSPKETEVLMEKVDNVISSGKSDQHEYKSVKDGRYFLQTFSPVKDSEGEITAVTIASKEITERKKMEEKLRILSITDELTGLYNRRGFFTIAEKQLKLANRMGKGVFLLYADLDNFKTINDTFGHEEGDSALLETGRVLKEIFRASDIIARMGGDEFAILALEYSETNIKSLIARLQSRLDTHNARSGKQYSLSLSLGMTRFDSQYPTSTGKLLSEADKLMYEQKRRKRLANKV